MRSYIATGTLGYTHLAEEFASVPTLNSSFIESSTPMSRIMSVTTEPDFIVDMYFDLTAVRPMPLHGIPGMLFRF